MWFINLDSILIGIIVGLATIYLGRLIMSSQPKSSMPEDQPD
jgi:hypothetical protein